MKTEFLIIFIIVFFISLQEGCATGSKLPRWMKFEVRKDEKTLWQPSKKDNLIETTDCLKMDTKTLKCIEEGETRYKTNQEAREEELYCIELDYFYDLLKRSRGK